MSHPSLNRRHVATALAASLALGASPIAFSQSAWRPTRPVRFLVGFSAGGSADTLARMLAEPMSQYLGQPFVVENLPGAGASIAMAQLARSAPDGHTIGMGSPGTHAVNPAMLGAKIGYQVPQDFTNITLLVTQANVLIVNNKLGVNTLAEFMAWVKANPNAAYGSAGVGTSNHLCGELLSDRMGLKLVHVPYKGASQVIADLLGGHIPMTFDNITTAAPMVLEGKVKAIAVSTARRTARLPDVPPLADALPGFDLASWQGLFAPRNLPAPIRKALYDATSQALKDAGIVRRLADLGSEVGGQSPEEFDGFIQGEIKRWGDIVRTAKLTSS